MKPSILLKLENIFSHCTRYYSAKRLFTSCVSTEVSCQERELEKFLHLELFKMKAYILAHAFKVAMSCKIPH